MSRLMLAGAAAIAAVVLAPQAPLAQNQARSGSSITVVAPGVRQMELQSGDKSLQPKRALVSRSVVYTGDLDLHTQEGRDALDSRVQSAAERTCDRLDRVDPPSALAGSTYSDCVYEAVQHAQNQVYAAIWSA